MIPRNAESRPFPVMRSAARGSGAQWIFPAQAGKAGEVSIRGTKCKAVLDRKCAEMRLWPAINIAASGTRKEELLIDAKTLEGIHFFRRALVQQKIEEATETMIARLSKTKPNADVIKLIAR